MARKKKQTRADKIKTPASSDLKKRVLEAKESLPVHGLTALFFHYFKDYTDTVKNRSRLNNVLQVRITDEAITERLEELVELLQKPEQTFKHSIDAIGYSVKTEINNNK